MYSYKDLCKILKNAVFSSRSPDNQVKPISEFYALHGLLGKVEYKYYNQSEWTGMNADLSPTFCVPCCPIDHLNGKEIWGALKNIFNYKKFLPVNYLCFSADGLLVASVLQTKNNMIEISPTPLLSTSGKKFRFIFSKLFDDDEVIR